MGRFLDVEQCDASEMDVTLGNAKFTLTIAGSKSDAYIAAITEARALSKRLAKRRNVETLSYEDQQQVVRLRAARCIVGWTGLKVPYSPAEAEALLEDYPTVVPMVISFSDADENFIQTSGAAS